MSRIQLTINQLVFRGFESGDCNAIVEGLQSELYRMLADPPMRTQWARSHRTPVLRLGRISLESGASGGRKLGKRMACAIGRGLKL